MAEPSPTMRRGRPAATRWRKTATAPWLRSELCPGPYTFAKRKIWTGTPQVRAYISAYSSHASRDTPYEEMGCSGSHSLAGTRVGFPYTVPPDDRNARLAHGLRRRGSRMVRRSEEHTPE